MKCEYGDGVRIDYSGSLRIRKGNEIYGYLVKMDGIPDTLRNDLDNASRSENCKEIRRISDAVVNGTPCGRICL